MKTKEEILKIFEENNIKNIDQEIINIIYLLNFKLDLPTRNSCSGHENGFFYIQFNENVDDQKIYNLCNYLSDNFYYKDNPKSDCDFFMEKSGRRYDQKLHFNWTFKTGNYYKSEKDFNKNYINKFEKCLIDYTKEVYLNEI